MKRACIAALLGALSVPASAFALPIYNEVGDAGSTLGTAQTVNVAGFDQIGGTITTGDADLFRFYITDPSLFSATTVPGPGTLTDTQLFLFNSAGFGVAFNDDLGATLRAELPVGNALYAALSPGYYYLGISGFNNDAVSAGGDIFPDLWPGVFGPTGSGGGQALTGFTGGGGTGTYTITLTAVATAPEPGSMLLLGTALVGMVARRRYQR